MEKFPTQEPPTTETEAPKENPNSIGDLAFSLSKDIPTTPDNVYRGVHGDAALHDLNEHGAVRNAHAAGVKSKNRWGTNVYWSRGVEGKYHNVQEGGYVIEAPHDIAAERAVRKEDVTAIYGKNEDGAVEDVKHKFLQTGSEEDRATALEALKSDMTSPGEAEPDGSEEKA